MTAPMKIPLNNNVPRLSSHDSFAFIVFTRNIEIEMSICYRFTGVTMRLERKAANNEKPVIFFFKLNLVYFNHFK